MFNARCWPYLGVAALGAATATSAVLAAFAPTREDSAARLMGALACALMTGIVAVTIRRDRHSSRPAGTNPPYETGSGPTAE
ncbi:hypothetical protein OG292_07910 [Streptomyces sp. NBC_01511]|uniref:hypothetical protein n=1 Tax=Streptomyces sp. NBC_01511 TaxID=2903889 RepID=UPI00386EBE0B